MLSCNYFIVRFKLLWKTIRVNWKKNSWKLLKKWLLKPTGSDSVDEILSVLVKHVK